MAIKVLLFASLTDLLGCDEVSLDLNEETTVSTALAALEESYPDLKRYQRRFRVAVNHEFCEDDDRVAPGDEMALIPPVSGGAGAHLRAAVRSTPLDMKAITDEVRRNDCGAVITFMGTVRDLTGSQVTDKLEYSAYLEMAEKKLWEVCREAADRWRLGGAVVEHRTGELFPGDIAVVAACSAPHRDDAFEAGRFLIDATKERVPLWKKEFGPDGEIWVEPDDESK